MRPARILGFPVLLLWLMARLLYAQNLAPRAYVITPVGANALTISENHSSGDIEFNDTVPITDASGTTNVFVATYYHGLNFFGRSANITLGLPYAVGTFSALVVDQQQKVRRSGLGDGVIRFAVNLKGGPAMKLPQFRQWKQKQLLGVSLLVRAPTGQYDPTKLINIGANRWAFKPEFGYSQRWGKWIVDAYGGVWFFTSNPEFFSHNSYFSGTRSQSQQPIGSFEGHLSRDFKPRLWVSIDGNFWFGGETSLNGVEAPSTLQRNSRVGATASVPISQHQSLKFSYANGAYIRYGGNYQTLTAAWQYSWIGRRLNK
jgi:hypothetical protein